MEDYYNNKSVKIISIFIYSISIVFATFFNYEALFFGKTVHITGFVFTIVFLISKILFSLVNVSFGNIVYSLFILINLIAWKMYILEVLDNNMLSIIYMVIIMPYTGLKYICSVSTTSNLIIAFSVFIFVSNTIFMYSKIHNNIFQNQ